METFHDESLNLVVNGNKYTYGRSRIMGRHVHFWFHVQDGKVVTDYVRACLPTPFHWAKIYRNMEAGLAKQNAKYSLIIRDVLARKMGGDDESSYS